MDLNHTRWWLVRTRQKEILGPFSQTQLQQELKKKTFYSYDEIAPSHAPWIRADILTSSSEEITRTCTTRSHTVTRNTPVAPAVTDNTPPPQQALLTEVKPSLRASFRSKIPPFLLGSLLVLGLWALIVQVQRPPEHRSYESALVKTHSADSPFLRDIYAHIARAQYQVAIDKLNQHHNENPPDTPDYLIPFSALLIHENQNLSFARNLLSKLTDNPNPALRALAHRWLGYLMLSLDEGDKGENHFLESLQIDPKDVAARFNLGRTYFKQERFQQSLDYLQLAELEMPNLWLIHIYKGRAKSALGQNEQAQVSFRRAVELEPDRWLSYVYFALFLASRQEKAAAQTMLVKMLARDSTYEQLSPPPWGFYQEKTNYAEYASAYNHIMADYQGGERTIGKTLLQSLARTLAPLQWRPVQDLALKGNRLARLALLRRTLASSPPRAEIDEHLVSLSGDMREFGPMAYVIRGKALWTIGNAAEAENDFKYALDLEPTSAFGIWVYYDFLSQSGRKSEAASQLEKLLRFHPNYIPAIVANQ